jgi:EmrB/QacA subfamily drug resistance transporter
VVHLSVPATRNWSPGRVWTLVVSCAAVALVMATVASLNTALPDLATDTGATQTQLTWIVDSYTLVLACLLLPAGALGDRYGRRRLLLWGCGVFGAACVVPVLAGQPSWVLGSRAVAGLGAAMVMPASLSIITATFPAPQRSRGVGLWAGFAGAGAVLGMLGASALLASWPWQSVFAASAIASALLLVAGLFVPTSTDEDAPRVDVLGATVSALAIGFVVFGLIEAPELGWTSPWVIGSWCAGVLAGTLFAVSQRSRRAALLDVGLFAERGFTAGTMSLLLQFMAAFAMFYLIIQYLQSVWNYSPLASGLALAPMTIPLVLVAVVAPWLTGRVGLRVMTAAGFGALVAALALFARLGVDDHYREFAVPALLFGLGLGLCATPATAAIVQAVPRTKQGVASAVNDAAREVGAALGIAIAGSLLATGYRNALAPALTDLPQPLADPARDSLPVALRVAAHAGPPGERLSRMAREAFVAGMHAALIALAIVVALGAVLVVLWAPRHRPAMSSSSRLDSDRAEPAPAPLP